MKNRSPASLPAFPFLSRRTLARVRVLVVGDIMLDRYWFGDVSRISPEAPVPVVQVQRCEDRLGGAANVARNIASIGACVTLVGVIGNDEAGSCVRRLLEHAAIGDALQVDADRQTVVKLRVLAGQQQLLRIDFDGERRTPCVALDPEELHRLVRRHHLVVLSDYAKGGISNPQSLIRAARRCRRPVLVDPKGDDFSCYAQATMLTPNSDELARIVGAWHSEEDLAVRAQQLRASLSLRALLLTRSAEGMTLFDDAGVHHSPTKAREVFDVCGAGDTVIAVLASLLACGVHCRAAIELANRAAGIAVGKLGTATVDYDELFIDPDADPSPFPL